MSPRKPLAALAAVTAAVAVAVPTTSASAAVPAPVPAPHLVPFTPPAFLCNALAVQVGVALRAGNPILAGLLVRTSVLIGCGGAAL
jgi:hypothetical protein